MIAKYKQNLTDFTSVAMSALRTPYNKPVESCTIFCLSPRLFCSQSPIIQVAWCHWCVIWL